MNTRQYLNLKENNCIVLNRFDQTIFCEEINSFYYVSKLDKLYNKLFKNMVRVTSSKFVIYAEDLY